MEEIAVQTVVVRSPVVEDGGALARHRRSPPPLTSSIPPPIGSRLVGAGPVTSIPDLVGIDRTSGRMGGANATMGGARSFTNVHRSYFANVEPKFRCKVAQK
jgi:hypothetical protein